MTLPAEVGVRLIAQALLHLGDRGQAPVLQPWSTSRFRAQSIGHPDEPRRGLGVRFEFRPREPVKRRGNSRSKLQLHAAPNGATEERRSSRVVAQRMLDPATGRIRLDLPFRCHRSKRLDLGERIEEAPRLVKPARPQAHLGRCPHTS